MTSDSSSFDWCFVCGDGNIATMTIKISFRVLSFRMGEQPACEVFKSFYRLPSEKDLSFD